MPRVIALVYVPQKQRREDGLQDTPPSAASNAAHLHPNHCSGRSNISTHIEYMR